MRQTLISSHFITKTPEKAVQSISKPCEKEQEILKKSEKTGKRKQNPIKTSSFNIRHYFIFS